MKRLVCFLPFLFPALLWAQHPKYDTYTGFAVDATPVLPANEVHPSLYFTSSDIPVLRARKTETSSRYYTLWLRFRADALKYITKNAGDLDENDRPRAAKTLAFWWLIEEDEQALQKAIEMLLLAYEGVPQTGEKPYDEIYRATWLQNYAAAYDWVFDRLNAEQNTEIRRRIAEEIQYLRDNLTEGARLAPRPHNHRSKPAWAIGTAALALTDHAHAEDWLRYALEAANSVTRYQFSSDGIYREGGHYWMYNAVNFIPFLWHYKNVSGVNLFEDYKPVFEWPIRIRTGRGWIPNVEDSYIKPAPTHMVAAAYHGSPTDLNPHADFAALSQWNYENTHIFNEDYTGATVDVTWEIDEYILFDDSIQPAPPTASPTQFLQTGQIVFRNRWTSGPNDRYLLFHGVAEADNHNHPDQLSFFLGGNDALLAPDAGYGPNGFSDDRRGSWYTTAKAHNIVTADGFPPLTDSLFYQPYAYNITPLTHHYINSSFFDFAEKQSGYLRPNDVNLFRAVGFVGEDYFVVADLLKGDISHTYRSYLHGRGRFDRSGHHVSWQPFANRYGEDARLDAFFFPIAASVTNATGYISLFKDERFEQYVEVAQTGQNAAFLQLLLPGPQDGPEPAAIDLSTDAYVAASLEKNNTADVFLLQHEPVEQALAALTTNATFAWSRMIDDNLSHFAFRDATMFRSGALALTAEQPATLALDIGMPGLLVIEPSQTTQAFRLEVSWPEAANVTEVRVRGATVPFDRNEDRISLTIGRHVLGSQNELPASPGVEVHNYPNPFRDATSFVIELEKPGTYRMDVFNLLGQKVLTLAERSGAPGTQQVLWDGRGSDGAQVPAGVYLVRLTHAEKHIVVRKVVRVQ